MAPFVVEEDNTISCSEISDSTILSLRKALTTESTPLAQRFRALFSLKHLASLQPPTSQTLPAISAIAAAFASPSALLKHELAYCLGQSRNSAAVPHLTAVLEKRDEDPMCRHEAAEALGALGDVGSLQLLERLRDDVHEEIVVRETCEIAVERIEWEHDRGRRESEQLKQRYVVQLCYSGNLSTRMLILFSQ
jgi:deoxyhypusine monooxygenase